MQNFEKKVFDSINRGYINLTRFSDTNLTGDVEKISSKEEEIFLENFRLFLGFF